MKNKGQNVFNDLAQTFKELKSSSESNTIVNDSIDKLSIEKKETDYPNASPRDTMGNNAIDFKSIDNKSINYKQQVTLGIHSTSIRVVREELMKALAGMVSAEVKIGDIVPLTGLTRRTVDRVCKYLAQSGEFTFERQHRGMKVTSLR